MRTSRIPLSYLVHKPGKSHRMRVGFKDPRWRPCCTGQRLGAGRFSVSFPRKSDRSSFWEAPAGQRPSSRSIPAASEETGGRRDEDLTTSVAGPGLEPRPVPPCLSLPAPGRAATTWDSEQAALARVRTVPGNWALKKHQPREGPGRLSVRGSDGPWERDAERRNQTQRPHTE